MKILILSSDNKPHLDVAFCQALIDIGHEATILNPFITFGPFFIALFLKYPPLCIYPFNYTKNLVKTIEASSPDLIILWRPVLIKRSLLLKIKEIGCPIHIVNNDDPFSAVHLASSIDNWIHLKLRWHHYKSLLPLCDLCWFYRPISLIEYIQKYKQTNCHLLPPFYVASLHIRRFDLHSKSIDVTFAGHFEPDGRDTALLALLDHGFNIRVYGPQSEWNNSLLRLKYDVASICNLSCREYADTLNKSRISLCFLSKINRDGYTRRCLEIPASGSLLVAERTEILESIFIDRKEAFFFSDLNELILIVELLCQDDTLLASATLAGQSRLSKLGLESKDVANVFVQSLVSSPYSDSLMPLFGRLFTSSQLDSYRKLCQCI